jgi:outer membrane protein
MIAAVCLIVLPATSARAQDAPLTLSRSQELARKNNTDLRQSQLEIEAAEQTRKATFTHYFPQVFATGALMLARDPFARINTQAGSLPVYDGNPMNLLTATQFAYMPASSMGTGNRMSFLSLNAMQPLFAGGRIYTGNRLAALGVEAARTQAAMKQRDTGDETQEKYWRIVTLQEKVRTLAAYDALLASLQKQVDDAVASGLTTQNDQLKVKLQRSQISIDSERLQSGIKLASRDLRRHLGLPDADAVELVDSLPPSHDPTPLRNREKESDNQRPELQLLQHAARAEELKVDMVRGEMLPTVTVGASLYRMDLEGMPVMNNAIAFGVINVPLSAVWTGVHETRAQQRRAEIAHQRLIATRKLIGLDVTRSWDELWTAWQVTKLSALALQQADVNLKEVTDRHTSGLVTFSDVLEAQALRQQALDKQIDSRSDYQLKRAAYLKAIGQEAP